MTNIIDIIRNRPTVYNNVHESVYRAYSILEIVKEWCEKGIPPDVILTWIEYLEGKQPPTAPTDAGAGER